MHVIEVNSGNRTNSQINQEDNALQVNVEAAREISRQLRLRDMGGIIVIDFIDMHKAVNRKQLYNSLRDEMKDDRRSEEHTSEHQSLMRIAYAVLCLKKKIRLVSPHTIESHDNRT